MTDTYHWIIDGSAPFHHLARVLDHLWADELKDHAANAVRGHMFESLVAIANWLNGAPGLSAEEYRRRFEEYTADGWRTGSREDFGFGPEAGADVVSYTRPMWDNSGQNWWYTGLGSYFTLKARTPPQVVTVSWSNSLSSFTAVVWAGPFGQVEDDESVLFSLGDKPFEFSSVDALAAALAPYAHVPDDLKARLETERVARSRVFHSSRTGGTVSYLVIDPKREVPYRSIERLLNAAEPFRWQRPASDEQRELAINAQLVEAWLYRPSLDGRPRWVESDRDALEVSADVAEIGLCPWCGWCDGAFELESERWAVCTFHKVRWSVPRESIPSPDLVFELQEWGDEREPLHYPVIEPVRPSDCRTARREAPTS